MTKNKKHYKNHCFGNLSSSSTKMRSMKMSASASIKERLFQEHLSVTACSAASCRHS